MYPRTVRLVALLAAALLGASAHAQSVKNGAVSGTVMSASGIAAATLLAVPAGKSFVLTQLCSEDTRSFKLTVGGNTIVPSTLEPLACQSFTPGVAVVGPASIVCAASGNAGFGTHCMITGILAK